MPDSAKTQRAEAVNELKRSLILAAARRVFELDGLEGATIRAIAREAGYTAGAIYFYFPSKEAIYGAILQEVIDRLIARVVAETQNAANAEQKYCQAALAFYDFFADNPQDLGFGFYLFGGGLRPRGLSREINAELNNALLRSLDPVSEAAVSQGLSAKQAKVIAASVFAHAVGLLLLKHTGRIRIFGLEPRSLMESYAKQVVSQLFVNRNPAATKRSSRK